MTTYKAALASGLRKGLAHANDVEQIAGLCRTATMLGAYSPQLLFEGTIKTGLTPLQLGALLADKDPLALDALQWAQIDTQGTQGIKN